MEQIIDISQDGRHLSRDRGFVLVKSGGTEIGRVALDQVAAVIVHGYGVTWSNSLLAEFGERGVPVVICGLNHIPRSVLLSLEGHHTQNARMRSQLDASGPLFKQAWKRIVAQKIRTQAAALAALGISPARLERIACGVQSGDKGNAEAQAARIYWPLMMGKDFRRDQNAGDINGLLNYGYTVLRATAARAVVAAGLHPTLGIFHSNRGNAFALADDLMEPFRPLVDLRARSIANREGTEVTSAAKRSMVELMALDFERNGETTPLSVVISDLAVSLAKSFEAKKLALVLPDIPDRSVLAGLHE